MERREKLGPIHALQSPEQFCDFDPLLHLVRPLTGGSLILRQIGVWASSFHR